MFYRVKSVRIGLPDKQGDLPLPEFSEKKKAKLSQLHGLMTRFKTK